MKKLLAALLVLAMLLMGVAALAEEEGHELALVTDVGNIDDQSFNQTTYEACQEFCDAEGLQFEYYKPQGDSTPERVAMVDAAVANAVKTIDMACSKGLIHKNNAARKKSSMTLKLNKLA